MESYNILKHNAGMMAEWFIEYLEYIDDFVCNMHIKIMNITVIKALVINKLRGKQ